jgi:hypothetical protein
VAYASSRKLQLYAGPIVKYGTTDLQGDQLIAQLRPVGSAGFGRVGMQGGVTASTSASADLDEARGQLVLNGSLYPPIWSPDATFGTFAVEATGRVPVPLGPTPWSRGV